MKIITTRESRFSANWKVNHEGKIYIRYVNFESGKIRWVELDNDGDWIDIGEYSNTLESTFSYL